MRNIRVLGKGRREDACFKKSEAFMITVKHIYVLAGGPTNERCSEQHGLKLGQNEMFADSSGWQTFTALFLLFLLLNYNHRNVVSSLETVRLYCKCSMFVLVCLSFALFAHICVLLCLIRKMFPCWIFPLW